jgi:hypothetical protein
MYTVLLGCLGVLLKLSTKWTAHTVHARANGFGDQLSFSYILRIGTRKGSGRNSRCSQASRAILYVDEGTGRANVADALCCGQECRAHNSKRTVELVFQKQECSETTTSCRMRVLFGDKGRGRAGECRTSRAVRTRTESFCRTKRGVAVNERWPYVFPHPAVHRKSLSRHRSATLTAKGYILDPGQTGTVSVQRMQRIQCTETAADEGNCCTVQVFSSAPWYAIIMLPCFSASRKMAPFSPLLLVERVHISSRDSNSWDTLVVVTASL